MAGILDSKKRFIDFQLTRYGRRQLSDGKLNFSFAVLSDRSTFYDATDDNPNVAGSATQRIMFEAASTDYDEIFPETRPDGSLFFSIGNQVFDGNEVYVLSGALSSERELVVGNNLIASGANLLAENTSNSFISLKPLRESQRNSQKFKLSSNEHTFTITDEIPISSDAPKFVYTENLPSVSQDYRLGELPTYKFLPPYNSVSKRQLRDYVDTRERRPENVQEFLERIGIDERFGKNTAKDFADIEFINPSPRNNIACQVFQQSNNSVSKLVTIDYGELEDRDPFNPGKHIVFVGMLVDGSENDRIDSTQEYQVLQSEPHFVSVFTLVFE